MHKYFSALFFNKKVAAITVVVFVGLVALALPFVRATGEANGDIRQAAEVTRLPGQCMFTSRISWETQNAPEIKVTVRDPETYEEKLFAMATSGNEETPWLTPGSGYRFTLWDISNGEQTNLGEVWVIAPQLDCSNNVAPTPIPTYSPTPTPVANSNFNISVNPQSACVGSESTFAISNATSDLNGKMIFWSSTLNGQPTGETLSGYYHYINNGSWSNVSGTWNSSHIGSWTKTATVGNVSKTVSFTVRNCSTPTPTPVPINSNFNLSVNPSVAYVGSQSTFSVSNATSDLNGKMIFWSSTLNGQPTGETLSGYYHYVNNGSWSDVSGTWNSSHVGSWTKTATIGNVSRTVSFTVRALPTPTPTYTPVFTPTPTPIPTISISPASMNFLAFQGGVSPAPQILSIWGSNISWSVSVSQQNNRNWLSTNLVGGPYVNNGAMSVNVNPNGLSAGTYAGAIIISGSFSGSPISIPVTLMITPTPIPVCHWWMPCWPIPTPTPIPTPLPTPTPTPIPTPIPTPTPTPVCHWWMSCSPTPTPIPTPVPTPTPAPVCQSWMWWCQPAPTPWPTPTYYPTPYPTPWPTYIPNYSNIDVNETVRNLTRGNSNESKSIGAQVGDSLEFIIRVNNYSNGYANNVKVYDNLPTGLRYQNGSTYVDGRYSNDGIINNGLYLGNLNAGSVVTVRFRATVENQYAFNYNSYTLNSVARATSDNIPGNSSTATVSVSPNNYQDVYNNQINLQKFGKNITKGETNEQSAVNASPSDTLEFVIKVRSLSNSTIYNAIVTDPLPSGIYYTNNSTSINGVITSDGITNSGINIGSLSPNQEIIIRFNARIGSASEFSNGTTSLTNVARVRADNTTEISTQLYIYVSNGAVAGASISKVAGVATGTTGSLVLSLLLSGLITFIYMNYAQTGIFKQKEAWKAVRRSVSDKNKFNFIS